MLPIIAISIAGCGKDSSEPAPAAETEPAGDTTSGPASLPRTPAPDGARVFFIAPSDGDTVSNPVVIEFGAEGVAIVKAGVDEPASGHHHLLIDAELPDPSLPIPASENYVHFGDGSSRTERTLAPGTHTLQLLLGDHLHIPHDPPVVSDVITITVE
ncbi:MAG: DUF4399 domain-containing protein [Woeseiaceae bacterium]|nr:DUF4399 domain-containing protein [Woeseiaceae bacterium]